MTLGHLPTDRYREQTANLGPLGSIKRQTCAMCKKNKSLGQFPVGSFHCVSCVPQGKNFRRGL